MTPPRVTAGGAALVGAARNVPQARHPSGTPRTGGGGRDRRGRSMTDLVFPVTAPSFYRHHHVKTPGVAGSPYRRVAVVHLDGTRRGAREGIWTHGSLTGRSAICDLVISPGWPLPA